MHSQGIQPYIHMYPFFPKHLSIQAAIILLSNWDTVRLSKRIKVIELVVSKKPFPETRGRVWAFWTPTIPDYLYGQKTNTALSFTNKLKYKNKLKKQRPVPCIMECLPAFPASTHWKPVTNHLSPPTHSPPSWQTKKKNISKHLVCWETKLLPSHHQWKPLA